MAKNRLGYLALTGEQERIVVGLCNNPATTEQFVRLLSEVRQSVAVEQAKSAQAFLVNNDPVTRGLALQMKGQMTTLDELITVIRNVTK